MPFRHSKYPNTTKPALLPLHVNDLLSKGKNTQILIMGTSTQPCGFSTVIRTVNVDHTVGKYKGSNPAFLSSFICLRQTRVSSTPLPLLGLPSTRLLNTLLRFPFLSYKMIAGAKGVQVCQSQTLYQQLQSWEIGKETQEDQRNSKAASTQPEANTDSTGPCFNKHTPLTGQS